ncbi:hypothetical protein GCM10020219_070080 [Nonomuraea dietziae]
MRGTQAPTHRWLAARGAGLLACLPVRPGPPPKTPTHAASSHPLSRETLLGARGDGRRYAAESVSTATKTPGQIVPLA